MNKTRRTELASVIGKLEALHDDLDSILMDETDAKDALEERFSETDRFSVMERNVDAIEDAISGLDDVIDELKTVE